MIAPQDLHHCREAIRTGSLSFHAASKLLPAKVRDPALALYAFCRLADDAVDDSADKAPAVLALRDRLDLVYAGRPRNVPADRAFAAVVQDFEMPRALPDALLEGLAWDAFGRQYQTMPDLLTYCARVASAVGAMMCVLMRVRDADALARACDLGLAMQLTNIARDVGEDARAGRLYLPRDWMREAGIDPEAWLQAPSFTSALGSVVSRLLAEADVLYERAALGISALPRDCRPAIQAAGSITVASARKPTKAVCQPAVLIKCCAKGEARVSPKEPNAETEPMAMLRLAGETVLAVTLMAMFDAVHDRASPTHRPMPSVTLQAEVAVMAKAKPRA